VAVWKDKRINKNSNLEYPNVSNAQEVIVVVLDLQDFAAFQLVELGLKP
jgi:hypothetical protein